MAYVEMGGGEQEPRQPRQAAAPYQPPAQPAPQPAAQPAAQPRQYGGTATNPYQSPSNPYQTQQGGGGYQPPPNAGSWNPYYQQGGQVPGSYNPYGYQGQGGSYDPYGYQAPQQAPTQPASSGPGQYASSLEGFDSGKLGDPTHNSVKYTFARLADDYAPTSAGFSQLIADPRFQQLGFQSMGNGNIRLPNGEVVDVVRGFQSGGQAWQWGTSGAVEAGQAAELPKDYQEWVSQYGNAAQPQAQGGYFGYGQQGAPPQGYPAGYDPYAAYYGYPPQGGYPQPPQGGYNPGFDPNTGTYPGVPPTQTWEQPSTPAPYTPAGASPYPQGGYQQDYPSYQYNPGYTALPGGYMPQPAYNQGYYPMPGNFDPTAQAFQYLGAGMFPGYGY